LSTGKGAEAMKKNDNKDDSFRKLLGMLKKDPTLVKQIVFHPKIPKEKLSSSVARQLARGVDADIFVDAKTFFDYVAGPVDGHPVAHCLTSTVALCAKGTQFAFKCSGGTQPTRPQGRKKKRLSA
jgi:hypothetical protein